ncbi:hypothetical protein Zmor_017492 [Zophobas morio]|uniref:Uncharacterized protein n=1 Tax=Zophobas morio TaxID=2755281 RepID=A0AA38ICB1_9CUCU|nr:hypothetical protein Zmor_017492 [Zophobas morio]
MNHNNSKLVINYSNINWVSDAIPASSKSRTPIQFLNNSNLEQLTREQTRFRLNQPAQMMLVVVGDPVKQAISDYTQAVSKKPEMKPFEQLVFFNTFIGSIVPRPRGASR